MVRIEAANEEDRQIGALGNEVQQGVVKIAAAKDDVIWYGNRIEPENGQHQRRVPCVVIAAGLTGKLLEVTQPIQ